MLYEVMNVRSEPGKPFNYGGSLVNQANHLAIQVMLWAMAPVALYISWWLIQY